MSAVMASERTLGHTARDVSAQRGLGYGIESLDPVSGRLYCVEVKGHGEDADTATLTYHELMAGRNSPQVRLVLVRVGPGTGGRARLPLPERLRVPRAQL